MKNIFTLILAIISPYILEAQTITFCQIQSQNPNNNQADTYGVGTIDIGSDWSVNVATPIGQTGFGDVTYSITYHPDGNMYGTRSDLAVFLEINPDDLSAEVLGIYTSSNLFGYTLSSAPDGKFYFTSLSGAFGSYDKDLAQFDFSTGLIGINSTPYYFNGCLTFINGELYARIYTIDLSTGIVYPNNKIVKVNLDDPANSKLVLEMPDDRKIVAMTTFNYDCDSSATYLAVRNVSGPNITGYDIYQFDEKEPSLTFVTEITDIGLITDFANPTEHLQFDCVPVLDLDISASGLGHEAPATEVKTGVPILALASAAPAILTNTVVDSVWVGLLEGSLDGTAEQVACSNSTDLECNSRDGGIVFHNLSHLENGAFVEAMRESLLYQNDAPIATAGTRTLAFVPYKKGYVGDTVFLHLPVEAAVQVSTTEALASAIRVPGIFSPDGGGVFQIHAGENTSIEELRIYNIWGTLVFTGENSQGWDGTVNGELAPAGAYACSFSYYVPGAGHRTGSGKFMLVR